jgi:hypothetical protein
LAFTVTDLYVQAVATFGKVAAIVIFADQLKLVAVHVMSHDIHIVLAVWRVVAVDAFQDRLHTKVGAVTAPLKYALFHFFIADHKSNIDVIEGKKLQLTLVAVARFIFHVLIVRSQFTYRLFTVVVHHVNVLFHVIDWSQVVFTVQFNCVCTALVTPARYQSSVLLVVDTHTLPEASDIRALLAVRFEVVMVLAAHVIAHSALAFVK